MNFLTIDLEDWHQAYCLRFGGTSCGVSDRLERQMNRLLALLDDAKVKATFFCLGACAQKRPDIIKTAALAGHEMQSHGFGHKRVYDLTPEEFRADVMMGKKTIEDIVGKEVTGYRAPEFSITNKSAWALQVLAECGFRYDSSIYPFEGKRYGWPGFSRTPIEIRFDSQRGGSIIEFPIFTASSDGRVIPLGGGGYFRKFPWFFIKRRLQSADIKDRLFYFHPYEFDDRLLRLGRAVSNCGIGMRMKIFFVQNFMRRSLPRKLGQLLGGKTFTTVGEYCGNNKPAGKVLFSSLRG
jgi:polysaccharide deacetylase family protein (PEP-CTERM system associated)